VSKSAAQANVALRWVCREQADRRCLLVVAISRWKAESAREIAWVVSIRFRRTCAAAPGAGLSDLADRRCWGVRDGPPQFEGEALANHGAHAQPAAAALAKHRPRIRVDGFQFDVNLFNSSARDSARNGGSERQVKRWHCWMPTRRSDLWSLVVCGEKRGDRCSAPARP